MTSVHEILDLSAKASQPMDVADGKIDAIKTVIRDATVSELNALIQGEKKDSRDLIFNDDEIRFALAERIERAVREGNLDDLIRWSGSIPTQFYKDLSIDLSTHTEAFRTMFIAPLRESTGNNWLNLRITLQTCAEHFNLRLDPKNPELQAHLRQGFKDITQFEPDSVGPFLNFVTDVGLKFNF